MVIQFNEPLLVTCISYKSCNLLKIPLVLHGENSAYEYSGDNSYDEKFLDHKWLKNMQQIKK